MPEPQRANSDTGDRAHRLYVHRTAYKCNIWKWASLKFRGRSGVSLGFLLVVRACSLEKRLRNLWNMALAPLQPEPGAAFIGFAVPQGPLTVAWRFIARETDSVNRTKSCRDGRTSRKYANRPSPKGLASWPCNVPGDEWPGYCQSSLRGSCGVK